MNAPPLFYKLTDAFDNEVVLDLSAVVAVKASPAVPMGGDSRVSVLFSGPGSWEVVGYFNGDDAKAVNVAGEVVTKMDEVRRWQTKMEWG